MWESGGAFSTHFWEPRSRPPPHQNRGIFFVPRKGERFVKCTKHCVFPRILFSDLAPLDDAVDVGRGGVEVPHALMGNLGTLKATNYNDFPREFRTNQTFKILHLVPQEAQSEGDARDQGEQGQAAPHRPALPLLGGAGVAATGAKVDQEDDQGRDQPEDRKARGLIRYES